MCTGKDGVGSQKVEVIAPNAEADFLRAHRGPVWQDSVPLPLTGDRLPSVGPQFSAIFRNFSFLLVPLWCSLVPCVSPVQKCCFLRLRGFARMTVREGVADRPVPDLCLYVEAATHGGCRSPSTACGGVPLQAYVLAYAALRRPLRF